MIYVCFALVARNNLCFFLNCGTVINDSETSHVMLGSNWYLNGVSFLDGPQLGLVVGFCWAEVEWVCPDHGLGEEEGLGMVNTSVWDEGESSRNGS